MEVFGAVAETYDEFADEASGESPCFESWARSIAADRDVVAWLEELPALKRQPNLVFAAARWHGVPAPGPYDALRAALLGDDGDIRQTILTRSTQTNEVGRLATLLPAIAPLGAELSLIELGASAGLCLYPDRYDYLWMTDDGDRTLEGSDGPVLTARADGPVPIPGHHPEIGWRAGIDLNPLDVFDADQMAWLTNLVWPEQDDRRARLQEAIAVTRADPPRIVPGDLLQELPALLAEAPGVPVVFHSAVIVYLDHDDRLRFVEMMSGLVARGACHWVSNESPRVLPAVRVPADVEPGRFLVCVDGTPVAWTHGHGTVLRWL
jgi:hypothetical protein